MGALDPDDDGDGEEVFSHTKALHTTEETRRANNEGWDLLRRRQRLRQQVGETAAKVDARLQEPWTALHFRIRELVRKLRSASRQTDRPMFFERVLNSTVRYDSDEGHFFATPQCGNLMGFE